MPLRTSVDRERPKPAPNRKSPISSATRSFSSRVSLTVPFSELACSAAAAWVKCTTYAGTWLDSSSSSTVSGSGVTAQVKLSGTGRSASSTTEVSRPVRRARSSTNRSTGPSVADISRNCAWGSSISGTCQAQPRSGSE